MRQEALEPNEAIMCASKWFDGSEGGNERKRFFTLIEQNKASQCPLKFIATQSPPTFGNPLIFGFAFRGRSYRRRRLPRRRLAIPHWLFAARRTAHALAGNNQRTADLAGKAANSRVLRTVSLFAGVANGTFVIFGTRSPCRQHKAAIRFA